MTNLAVVLHRWRINEGRTMRQAGRLVGISAATWLRIEHGYGLDGTTLVKLLTWFMRPALPPAREAAKPARFPWQQAGLVGRDGVVKKRGPTREVRVSWDGIVLPERERGKR